MPEGNGKALDINTPIPTPDGWTTMGEIQAGDIVLGSVGQPVRVTFANSVAYNRECFDVRFSDGSSIVADAEHLWAVEGAHDRYRPRVLSTTALLDAGVHMSSGAHRWRVATAARRGEKKDLLVDPYVLGVWLGDGASACGRVTNIDKEIWKRVKAAGYSLGSIPPSIMRGERAYTRTVLKLRTKLGALGVLKNKHIPDRKSVV